jgi:GxxExxY protein
MTDRHDASHLAHAEFSGRILACFYDVASSLGHGFSEAVLERALSIALEDAGLRVDRRVALEVSFRGRPIGLFFADLIVERTILIEVKATATIENYAVAQTLNYLKAAGGGVALLLNFGRKAESKRLVMGDPWNSLPALPKPEPVRPSSAEQTLDGVPRTRFESGGGSRNGRG